MTYNDIPVSSERPSKEVCGWLIGATTPVGAAGNVIVSFARRTTVQSPRTAMKTLRMLLILFLAGFIIPALAADDPADAIVIVNKGLEYIQKNGKDALIKEVNAKNPLFIKGAIYLTLRSIDGTTLAHPFNPRLVGKNLVELHDADGKFFRKEIIEIAKTKGKGWVDFRYNNPKTKEVEKKSTYLVRSGDMILEAGIYKGK